MHSGKNCAVTLETRINNELASAKERQSSGLRSLTFTEPVNAAQRPVKRTPIYTQFILNIYSIYTQLFVVIFVMIRSLFCLQLLIISERAVYEAPAFNFCFFMTNNPHYHVTRYSFIKYSLFHRGEKASRIRWKFLIFSALKHLMTSLI